MECQRLSCNKLQWHRHKCKKNSSFNSQRKKVVLCRKECVNTAQNDNPRFRDQLVNFMSFHSFAHKDAMPQNKLQCADPLGPQFQSTFIVSNMNYFKHVEMDNKIIGTNAGC